MCCTRLVPPFWICPTSTDLMFTSARCRMRSTRQPLAKPSTGSGGQMFNGNTSMCRASVLKASTMASSSAAFGLISAATSTGAHCQPTNEDHVRLFAPSRQCIWQGSSQPPVRTLRRYGALYWLEPDAMRRQKHLREYLAKRLSYSLFRLAPQLGFIISTMFGGIVRAIYKIAHSITSSARNRKDSGIFSPSALAVFRLTTSSNLVGCSTGRSAGFSPLRIRPA
jgi:hypothetical protein